MAPDACENPIQESPFHKLPPEILHLILRLLSPSNMLFFRQTSRHFYLNTDYARLLRAVRKGLDIDWSERASLRRFMETQARTDKTQLYCAFCLESHAADRYDSTEQLKQAGLRICRTAHREIEQHHSKVALLQRFHRPDDDQKWIYCFACKGHQRREFFSEQSRSACVFERECEFPNRYGVISGLQMPAGYLAERGLLKRWERMRPKWINTV
ncbi:MAG: hypothetical protein M1819_004304 [Sarea resinae]|nr:MAG: hypothetical protein M1819_004304 [Sarea resinae]